MGEPSRESLDKMWKFVKGLAEKSRTTFHPNPAVTEAVVNGLAAHMDDLGKPLCPCNFYPDKQAEAKLRRWICACKASHHGHSTAPRDGAGAMAESKQASTP